MYKLDEELLRGSCVVEDADSSRDSLKLEYAGGVGAAMVDGSKSSEVLKLSSVDVADSVGPVALSADVLVGRKFCDEPVVSSDASIVAGGAIAAVVVSFTVFNKFSLAVAQGSSGLLNDGRLVKDGTELLND